MSSKKHCKRAKQANEANESGIRPLGTGAEVAIVVVVVSACAGVEVRGGERKEERSGWGGFKNQNHEGRTGERVPQDPNRYSAGSDNSSKRWGHVLGRSPSLVQGRLVGSWNGDRHVLILLLTLSVRGCAAPSPFRPAPQPRALLGWLDAVALGEMQALRRRHTPGSRNMERIGHPCCVALRRFQKGSSLLDLQSARRGSGSITPPASRPCPRLSRLHPGARISHCFFVLRRVAVSQEKPDCWRRDASWRIKDRIVHSELACEGLIDTALVEWKGGSFSLQPPSTLLACTCFHKAA
ncbi:hypothetical protein BDV96DRAFT_593290 [Lophiotrema nucula]|uniref:Uncharacterized protein n=1 Tax=Lophiotrema nucula TaxID=690887 RepID=A0A6A5ZUN4_9PLEO|nr:hypothetical protein BDV96DRAFT_593290 [Lophiotrema nucula]